MINSVMKGIGTHKPYKKEFLRQNHPSVGYV